MANEVLTPAKAIERSVSTGQPVTQRFDDPRGYEIFARYLRGHSETFGELDRADGLRGRMTRAEGHTAPMLKAPDGDFAKSEHVPGQPWTVIAVLNPPKGASQPEASSSTSKA
jgi:hypothetical protein